MYIIHCLKEDTWDVYKNQKYYGEDSLCKFSFVYCSETSTYQWVTPNFKDETGCFSAEEKKSEVPAARLCSKLDIFQ